jgi:hypothetical protein
MCPLSIKRKRRLANAHVIFAIKMIFALYFMVIQRGIQSISGKYI